MHPRIQEVIDALDTRRAELTRAMNDVPEIARSRRPSEDRWSVAEIVEHLALVEENISQLVRRLAAEGRAKGLGPETESSPVAHTFNAPFMLDRSQKRVAREAVQPRRGTEAAAAWTHLERSRQMTRDALCELDGLALCEVGAPHPALGPLNGYQWFLLLAAHEARHTAQIRETSAAVIG